MTKYTPFLKAKSNEVGALQVLEDGLKAQVTPFFDLPMKKGLTGEALGKNIDALERKIGKLLKDYHEFYLDDFDIPDAININGGIAYQYLISAFDDHCFIPVVGIDRPQARNDCVFSAKALGGIKSDKLAIRVLPDDFSDYELVRSEIEDLLKQADTGFSSWVLVLDNRDCRAADISIRSQEIRDFILGISSDFDFEEIIVAGSSIPSSIRDVAAVGARVSLDRAEVSIFKAVKLAFENIGFGDYTIISPNYSDIDIPVESMRNVTAPKVIYSYNDSHYILRGYGLKTHPRGNYQYNDMLVELVGLAIYRLPPYSFGDYFIDEKSKGIGSLVTQSSILKPTINAHITYMLKTL